VTEPLQSTLRCPQCGGENPLPSGERLVVCAFCEAALFVDRSGLVSHYRVPPLLDAAEALAALKRWMAGNETVKDLDRKAEIGGSAAVSFPMWMFRCQGAGGGTVVVEPAAPTPITQLVDLEVPAGRLEPFRAVEPGVEAVPAAVPLDTARGWLAQRGAGEVTETALVEVPLWRFAYRYGGRDYTALVDGSTGKVMASVFPAKAESPYYLMAAVGLLLFGLEGLAITNVLLKLFAFGVTAVPLTLVAWLITRRV
jgi:hypothetical protein